MEERKKKVDGKSAGSNYCLPLNRCSIVFPRAESIQNVICERQIIITKIPVIDRAPAVKSSEILGSMREEIYDRMRFYKIAQNSNEMKKKTGSETTENDAKQTHEDERQHKYLKRQQIAFLFDLLRSCFRHKPQTDFLPIRPITDRHQQALVHTAKGYCSTVPLRFFV